jgi:hypothetical protein
VRGCRGRRGVASVTAALALVALTAAAPAGAVRGETLSAPGLAASTSLAPSISLRVGLCREETRVNELRVVRTHLLNGERFRLPAVVTSTRVAKVRALARVLCALPPFPAGLYCPEAMGPLYSLHFAVVVPGALGAVRTETVTLNPTGCAAVTGLGHGRVATTALFSALGAALGLAHATRSTFAGQR